MKAADITDAEVFAVIDRVRRQSNRWAHTDDLELEFPDIPPKVVLAKARQMINKGRMNGCGCGCRGDFERRCDALSAKGIRCRCSVPGHGEVHNFDGKYARVA